MFAFDAVFTDADADADATSDTCNGNADSQAELNAATLCDVIHAVINGYDGCVFCFGHPRLECGQSVRAAVGSALLWLFAAIQEQRRRTGARFSVRVSALSAGRANVADLLADYNSECEQSPGELLREVGAGGHCPTELRATSAEHAASHLDHAAAAAAAAAPAAPSSPLRLLLYRLLVYQHRVTPDGQVVGGRSRLHLLEVMTGGSQERDREMPLSGLGNLLLAVFNGSKNIPYRNQRAAQVVRECLSPVTSHAAMVVHACPCAHHYQDTLTTLQLAARVHRLRHRSSSARGLSAGCRGSWEPGAHGLRRSSSSELEPSSSELSADTVIYLGARALHATIPGRRPPVRHQARPLTGPAAVEETWVDGPRAPPAVAPRAASQDQPLRETWVDGPALESQKRLMVSQWLASQVSLPTTQPPRPEADGAADRQRDHGGAPGGSGCVSHQRAEPPPPQQVRPGSSSEARGSGEVDGGAEEDVDDVASTRRVEGVETRLHVWEAQHPQAQAPLTIAAQDLKLELSFEVELQLGGQRRLSGEGREDREEAQSQSDSSRPCLVAFRDACVQVTEEELSQNMGEEDMDHPLRILSQENMTVVSTFADSASGSYSLDGMRVHESRRQRQARPWRWGWESPPLCRSQSASAADVRLALRRPAAAGRAADDADVDVDDWEGSLASEPPPVTDRRLQRGLAAITPDLIRGARPAHRSLPAHRRTAALGDDGGVGGPGAPAVGGPECPWTLQRPDGASNPSVADHDPVTIAPAASATVPRVWDSATRPLAGLSHAVSAPHRDKEDSVRRYGVECWPAPRLDCRQRPGPAAPPPPPPPPLPAGYRRERTVSPVPRPEPAAEALPAGALAGGDVIPSWRQRLRMVASKLSCNCG